MEGVVGETIFDYRLKYQRRVYRPTPREEVSLCLRLGSLFDKALASGNRACDCVGISFWYREVRTYQ